MSNAPPVSVVVPTYNGSALLVETLGSILSQTFGDFELIVVDDGSTDDTPDRLAAVDDPRLRVVRQANAGVGAARNRGVDESAGRYVAFCDHDDLWMPRKLAAQVAFMDDRPACVGCAVPWGFSTRPGRAAFDPDAIAGVAGVVDRPIRLLASVPFWQTCATMVRRDAADGLRHGTERGAAEDREFQIALFARGPVGVARVPGEAVSAVYRVHGGNYSGDPAYSYHSMRRWRRLQRAGGYGDLGDRQRDDLRAFLAQAAHETIAHQLVAGRRRRAAALYLAELGELAAAADWRFLAAAPIMALMPRPVVRARWAKPDIPGLG